MDGRFRRHFKGTPSHVKIGYGSNKGTRFLMPDGFLKVPYFCLAQRRSRNCLDEDAPVPSLEC
jgi:hypothetical protein